MASQWDYFLQNLGEWQGSFTQLSPQGEEIQETPTLVSFTAKENNTLVQQIVRRYYPDKPPEEQEYLIRSLSRGLLFFENGAFSLGSMQWSPFSQFGAELGLIESQRRLRLVQRYDQDSQLQGLTLIREKLQESSEPERPTLTVEQLWGTWQGTATTLYPDWRSPDTYPTRLTLTPQSQDEVEQTLQFGDKVLKSRGKMLGSRIIFDSGEMTIQVCLLPDGASANCPLEIKPRCGFVLESGWLLSPTQRQRLIRRYNDQGTWVSLTLVKETKIS